MVLKSENNSKGFTLIEVLAVIVIIAIIAAIAVPAVKNILTESKRDTFGLSAQKVLDGVLQQEAINDEFEATEISVQNLKDKLKIANTNYDTLFIMLTNDNEYHIYIEGKNKWKGLVACGTHGDITVETKDNINICVVPDTVFMCSKNIIDSRDQQEYGTVKVGNQCWLDQNLNFECNNYSVDPTDDDWNDCTDCCAPGVGDFINTMLYQWEAAKEACPSGWHLATDEEWQELEMALGMTTTQAEETYFRGGPVGDKLKDFEANWCATNDNNCGSSFFKALPTGYRDVQSPELNWDDTAIWWTATDYYNNAWFRSLSMYNDAVNRGWASQTDGYAARCVKD